MRITLALKEAIEMVQEGLLALLGVETPPALSLPCTTMAQCWAVTSASINTHSHIDVYIYLYLYHYEYHPYPCWAVTSASNGTLDDRWRPWDDFWRSWGHC